MHRLLFILLAMISTVAIANEEDNFIASWENVQKESKYIEVFEKVEKDLYTIKFSKMPYEGSLKIISYDIQDISYDESPITSSGIVYFELVDIPADFVEKYNRIYYNWSESNELYYNSIDGNWITTQEYRVQMKDYIGQKESSSIVVFLLDNWDYIFFVLIAYFVISSFSNNRKVKQSIKLQQDAIKTANELQEQSLKMQSEAINTSNAMHKQTNDTLKEILEQIRK